MNHIAACELICLFFEAIVAFGLWQQHDHRKSTTHLLITLVCNMLALLCDAISRSINTDNLSVGLSGFILLISYLLGNVSFIPFILYCKAYIEEKMEISKWLFRVPLIISVCIMSFIVIGCLATLLMPNNMEVDPNAEITPAMMILPMIFVLMMVFVLVYLPVVAFRRRKYIGLRPAVLMGIFGIFPLTSALVFQEYIVIAGSMALVIVTVIMQNSISYEREQNEKILKEKADELIALNKELETAKAMAEATSEFKTIFLNNMSHDIRTPMNAIMGFTSLMEKSLDDASKMSDYLEKINRSGEYLLSIINNILEVAKIDSGSEAINEDFVNLNNLRGSITPLFENEILKKSLSFSAILEDLEHPYVYADVLKLNEIAMNLVGNAMKYTPEGGKIRLEARELPSEKEDYARFELVVTDNGIGMSKEFLEHIFEAFARERNTTESKVIGTGLGMSIVKKLIDLMGGTIDIQSELGKGTTVHVVVDLRIVEDSEIYLEKNAKNANKDINLSGKRILLAEDNDLNAEIAKAILGEYNINVERAADGVICINMLDNAADDYYDMILMDIQMPNMNGYDATKHIRSMSDTKKSQIPIVALTANAFEEDKKKAFDVGMNDFLSKPIDITKLVISLNNTFL